MYDEIDYCATCKHYDCEPHFEPCVSCKTKYDGPPTKYSAKKRTNADRIRAMSDEELGKFLGECKFCDICDEGCDNCTYHGDCDKRLLDWLKQPAEEE